MRYILAISVGPVQDFIAAARKTRDLWAGSEMLSEISRQVAIAVGGENCELIFPAPESVNAPEINIANKIVAIVPDEKDPATVADAARVRAQLLLDNWLTGVRQLDATIRADDAINWPTAEAQVKDFLEFFAAWWPYKVDEEYAHARDMADKLLAGRKALRDFMPAVSDEGVPKSSLDGGRDAVIDGRDFEKHPDKRLALGVSGKELLDGISLMKRLYKKEDLRFVSVSRVAADPFLRAVAREFLLDLNTKMDSLKGTSFVQYLRNTPEHFSGFPFDTNLLFGPPSDAEFEREGTGPEEKTALEEFWKQFEKDCSSHGMRPYPYVAVLHADGDFMGGLISKITRKDKHREFSGILAEFAGEAKDIVNSHFGSLVYSGGDDVLAFLPLDKALECADKLRAKFASLLKPIADEVLDPDDAKPSFSVGIAIGHFQAPLQTLVEWSRRAEKAAKQRKDHGKVVKNALAVHLHTHSAGDEYTEAVRGWEQDPVTSFWQKWIGYIQQKEISSGTAYHLRDLWREFEDLSLATPAKASVLEAEARRIIKRKRESGGSRAQAQVVQDDVLSACGSPLRANLLNNTVNEIIISRKLVEGTFEPSRNGGSNP